jgi:sigma-B regulation protein RsbU (phosphoserine phosphatase)
MLRKNLAVQIIAGFVLVIAILTVFVCIIGYRYFTSVAETQYEDCALHTAKTAALYIMPELLTGEIAGSESQMRFKMLKSSWERLVNTQDATFIYLIRPDKSNYNHIEFFMSVMNESADYELYNSGYVRQTTNEEYRQAYRDICENDREKATIFRDKGDSKTGHHITVMIPIKSKNSESVDWILCVQRQMEYLNFYRKSYVRHVALAAVVIVVIVCLVYGVYLGRFLIVPVKKIANEAQRFADEHTESESPLSQQIKSRNEIGQLAHVLDAMELQVLNYIDDITKITQEKEQIKAELSVATEIQASMLPHDFPKNKEFDLYASMTPAKEVGGDFYDFFMIDSNHLALVMADVSGKGVPAALFMVIAKTLIKNRAQMGGSPSEVLADVNRRLCESNEAELFVTVWLGILETSTGHVIASNAGHEYPAVMKSGGDYELLKTKQSPAVATLEGLKFRQNEFDLHSGDTLYLYTDGVAEATNSDEMLYGTDRMLEALNMTKNDSAEEVLISMKKSVDDFTGEAPQFDDITMLCLKYFGGENSMKELTIEAKVENLDEVLAFVDEQLEAHDCSMKIQTQIDIAVEELFVNIAHYAYNPETGPATLRVEIQDEPLSVVITFIDNGIPYDPLAKPDPDITLSAEERQIGGLGIYMVKKSMDNITYEYKDGKNILSIQKNLN